MFTRDRTRRKAMATTAKDMVAKAKEAVPAISPQDARALMERPDVLFVDVRDPTEVEKSGKVKGAVNVSRGMLEFRADPESPYHDKNFSKDKTVVLYCASGGRSALSGQALLQLGYTKVHNLGTFKDAADAGLPTEPA
jgi:rhodanese-related sulfurtransferase